MTAFELGNGTWSVPFPDRARSLPREKLSPKATEGVIGFPKKSRSEFFGNKTGLPKKSRSEFFGINIGFPKKSRSEFFGINIGCPKKSRSEFFGNKTGLPKKSRSEFFGNKNAAAPTQSRRRCAFCVLSPKFCICIVLFCRRTVQARRFIRRSSPSPRRRSRSRQGRISRIFCGTL